MGNTLNPSGNSRARRIVGKMTCHNKYGDSSCLKIANMVSLSDDNLAALIK